MNTISKAVTVLGALALSSAHATDLRIYQNFGEVRTPVTASATAFQVDLPDSAWSNLIPGTLDLEGLPYTQAVQMRGVSWLTSLEGKTVTLREANFAGPDKTQTVTLVRAADLLIKDASGQYRNVAYSQLSFPTLPPLNAQQPRQSLVYTLTQTGKGTLSYLTRALSWTPRYTLKTSGSSASLSALADIRNNADQVYNVTATELLAGQVDVQDARPVMYESRVADMAGASAPMPAPKVGALGTVNGLYRYGLDSAFTLPANSTYTLPFLAPKLSTFERYASLSMYFDTQKSAGTLNRSYRFKADQNLPGGQLTVREDGRISGQTSLDETAKGENVEFSLGRDPDVRYTRTVQTISSTKTGGTYKVTYSFESSKNRQVRAEISEQIGGRKVIIDGVTKANQSVAELRVDVPAGGKASKSFTVVIDNTQ
ncbi:hypothetical protein EHF33_07235 [Deinococcus psychrotolerans]|uniref:DUF4139 domain-containing protein n=1 Tax=Deinococcus psychrotolerans TaxID=2489213 RepID=A0A3G8YCB4_9DEIO|nr:DUF4139 domain-containing protein [Deinococcus psychrotolerans]AZI42563.1 hypothetical protein EHF33_07235 [Deinococcus psychrotolerans]